MNRTITRRQMLAGLIVGVLAGILVGQAIIALADAAQPADPPPSANITVTADPVACVITVDATWGGPKGIGFVQVNVDGTGRQEDNGKTLLLPGGDGAYPAPGSKRLVFTLQDGQAHTIDVWTALTNLAVNHVHASDDPPAFVVDCRENTPPVIVEVPVDRRVEVPVETIREVIREVPTIRTVVQRIVRYRTVRCEHRRNARGVLVIVKGTCKGKRAKPRQLPRVVREANKRPKVVPANRVGLTG